MGKSTSTDIAIVGAGTTGSYLAWRLANRGHKCLVLEKEPLEKLGTHIGPFHMEEVAFERFDIPLPTGDELLHSESRATMFSPSQARSFQFELPVLVMDKPRFIQRLHGYARDAGVKILPETEVVGLMREDGILHGVTATGKEGEVEVKARLVVDASGIDSVVRRLMPHGGWLENDPISDGDTFIVYMETWRDIEGDMKPGMSTYPYYQGWCAPGPGDTRIVGIGMMGSPEAAKRRHAGFVKTLPYTGKVVGSTGGRVPYRRPPYSLVDNGFMVAGDAAYMNKPFSGEGVISSFAACVIAEEVADRALKVGDTTREALWPYNVRYFRDQGAKFAFLTAVAPALMSISESEMDFFFSVPGLLNEKGATELQLEYEVSPDPDAMRNAAPAIAQGLLSGELKLLSLLSAARTGLVAALIKKQYQSYPEHPMDFGAWVRKVHGFWRSAEKVKYKYFAGA